jgi:hypothetical protein
VDRLESPGFGEFELDIERAFADYLPPFLDGVEPAQLSEDNIRRLPGRRNGVYLLMEGAAVRYVGKTDQRSGFQDRLLRHAQHIRHRRNLDPSNVLFKAVSIPVFKNADIEPILIRHYGAIWNGSGFGANDPGAERDTQRPGEFDLMHPVDVGVPLDFIDTSTQSCRTILRRLAERLPYTFRYEKKTRQDDLQAEVSTAAAATMREVLHSVVGRLPSGVWQATVLHGRVILYPQRRDYEFMQEIIR